LHLLDGFLRDRQGETDGIFTLTPVCAGLEGEQIIDQAENNGLVSFARFGSLVYPIY